MKLDQIIIFRFLITSIYAQTNWLNAMLSIYLVRHETVFVLVFRQQFQISLFLSKAIFKFKRRFECFQKNREKKKKKHLFIIRVHNHEFMYAILLESSKCNKSKAEWVRAMVFEKEDKFDVKLHCKRAKKCGLLTKWSWWKQKLCKYNTFYFRFKWNQVDTQVEHSQRHICATINEWNFICMYAMMLILIVFSKNKAHRHVFISIAVQYMEKCKANTTSNYKVPKRLMQSIFIVNSKLQRFFLFIPWQRTLNTKHTSISYSRFRFIVVQCSVINICGDRRNKYTKIYIKCG